MKCMQRLRGSNSLLTMLNLNKIMNIPNLPSWADNIVEPRPDMTIKVVDYTVAQ